MMDGIELLKSDWKKQDQNLPILNTETLYAMKHKSSASLTQWIYIIAIIEFVFWAVITLLTYDSENFTNLRKIHLYNFNMIATGINFVVLFVFIILFYRNYKAINTTENTKILMRRILKVRKTVNAYVIYNLVMAFAISVIVIWSSVVYDPAISSLWDVASKDNEVVAWGTLAVMAFTVLIVLFLIWLFYRLLYGILLRRLKRNYKELNRLELNK